MFKLNILKEENRNVCFNSVVNCLRLGIKLDIFTFTKEQFFQNKILIQLFESLVQKNPQVDIDIVSIPFIIETILKVNFITLLILIFIET